MQHAAAFLLCGQARRSGVVDQCTYTGAQSAWKGHGEIVTSNTIAALGCAPHSGWAAVIVWAKTPVTFASWSASASQWPTQVTARRNSHTTLLSVFRSAKRRSA